MGRGHSNGEKCASTIRSANDRAEGNSSGEKHASTSRSDNRRATGIMNSKAQAAQANATVSNRPGSAIDQAPAEERWHKLPGSKNIFVSVEAAPKNFYSEADWKYRAVTYQVNAAGSYGRRLLTEQTSQHSPEEAAWKAVKPVVADKRRGVQALGQADISALLKQDPESFPHRQDAERVKDFPQPITQQNICLYAELTREEDLREDADDWHRPDVRFQYQLGGYSLDDKGMEIERVPANFTGSPDEIYLAVRTYNEGDTFGVSYGMKSFEFAFDSPAAAQEYIEYVTNYQPRFQYWGYSEEYTIEKITYNG